LKFIITMCLNSRKKLQNPLIHVNLIDNDFELFLTWFCLISTSKRNLWCFKIFPFFFKKIWRKSFHNMSLMLNLNFTTLCLILFRLVNHEGDVTIIEDFDKRSMYFMLLKCYYHLHLVLELEVSWEDQAMDKVNIFEWIVSIN